MHNGTVTINKNVHRFSVSRKFITVFTESLHCIISCASLFQFITCFPMIDIYFLLFQEETPDEDETFNIVYSLKKVATFYNFHNLGNWGVWDSIFKDISDAKDGNKTLPEEVISPFNYVLYFVQHNTHFLSQKILYNILLCFIVQRCFRCNYSIFPLNLPCKILLFLWSMKYVGNSISELQIQVAIYVF